MGPKGAGDLVALPLDELEDNLLFPGAGLGLQSGVMSNIKYSLQNLRVTRESLLNKYKAQHPEVVSVDKQIQHLQLAQAL